MTSPPSDDVGSEVAPKRWQDVSINFNFAVVWQDMADQTRGD